MYIDTRSPVPNIPSKSCDLADENKKLLTEKKWFETSLLNIFDQDYDKLPLHNQWASLGNNKIEDLYFVYIYLILLLQLKSRDLI
jgi:hypothetical protein